MRRNEGFDFKFIAMVLFVSQNTARRDVQRYETERAIRDLSEAPARTDKTIFERFISHVTLPGPHDAGDGCWEWEDGSIDLPVLRRRPRRSNKYPVFSPGYSRRTIPAYRFSYEQFVGAIPHHTDIHHTCRNTKCVRPSHLRALTRAEHAAEHGRRVW
jgi:hypothetical protein